MQDFHQLFRDTLDYLKEYLLQTRVNFEELSPASPRNARIRINITDLPEDTYPKKMISWLDSLEGDMLNKFSKTLVTQLAHVEEICTKKHKELPLNVYDYFDDIHKLREYLEDHHFEDGVDHQRVNINDFLWLSIDTATLELTIRVREDRMYNDNFARKIIMPRLMKKLRDCPFTAKYFKLQAANQKHTYFYTDHESAGIYLCFDLLKQIRQDL